MKKLLATALVGAAVALSANGQGTVYFCNYFTGTASDPIIYSHPGVAVSGSQYRVGLYGGPSAAYMSLLATTTFIGQGYFVGPIVPVFGVAGGAIGTFEVVAWDSTIGGTTTDATFAVAFEYACRTGRDGIAGESCIFTNPTGNPGATPPGLPADLVNMTSFNMVMIPEPSFGALAVLAGVLVCMKVTRTRL